METETLNLIIGGAIGFLASFLITISGFLYQSYDRNRKRNWELSDRRTARRSAIHERRLLQVEAHAAALLEWAHSIYVQYPTVASPEKLEAWQKEYLRNSHLLANALPLENRELNEAIKQLGTSCLELFNWLAEGELFQQQSNPQELADIYESVRQDYGYALQALDDYRLQHDL